jgi:hypothetical protein
MFMQNFSFLASTQTELGTFLSIFEENFRNFQENSFDIFWKIEDFLKKN